MSKQSNIPKLRFKGFEGEWKNKTLIEVSNKITDGTHDTPKPTKEGAPFLTAIHIKDGFVDYDNCYYLDQEVHNSIFKRCNPEKDDLLIVNIGAGTATCAINSVDFEFSLKNVALVKPNKDILNGKFLAQIQRKKTSKIFNQLTSGGAQPFLSLKEIGKLKIILPTLPEQEKIASFLSAVDEKIQQVARKAELLEQYKKGLMQQLFSGQLRFKDENGEEYPDWEEKVLDDVIHFVNGKGHEQYIDDKGRYVVVNSKFVSSDGKVRKYCNTQISPLSKGDIVMVMSDVPNGKALAKCYLIEKENVYTLNQRICGLKAKNNNSNEFLIYILNRNRYYLGFDSGVGQTNLKKDEVLNCPLFIPTSIEEQQKIAGFLLGIDEKIGVVNGELEKMKEFKKGLLQQMFV